MWPFKKKYLTDKEMLDLKAQAQPLTTEQQLEVRIKEGFDELYMQVVRMIYGSDRFKNLLGPGFKVDIVVTASNSNFKFNNPAAEPKYTTGLTVEF